MSEITLNEYQSKALTTALINEILPSEREKLYYLTLGVSGESGEIAEKVKKIIRDNKGEISETAKAELAKEMGDVLWYLSVLANHLGFSLEDVAQMNLKKLASRNQRNLIHGDGDNR